MKCFNCNKEINDGAKFCKFCGSQMKQIVSADASSKTCPKCGQSLPVSSKFCKYCGESLASEQTIQIAKESSREDGVDVHSNYITWHVLPGQLALKIDERDIEQYKTIKGVYITPGTKALFFVNGKFAATLDSGTYPFVEYKNTALQQQENLNDEPKKQNKVVGFFRNIARHISNGVSALFGGNRVNERDDKGNRVFYTVVLIRSSEFPLVFDFEKLQTRNLPTDIGIHIRCKITNLNLFFEDMMVDKKVLSLKGLSDSLSVYVHNIVSQIVSNKPSEEIGNTAELSASLLKALQEGISSVYPYMTVSHIINFTAHQKELEQIRQLKNELYVAEKELEHLQLRYDYMNRLQSVENDQKLREARTRVDFEAVMDEIDNDSLLNADKKRQFVEMLEAQAALRRATSQVEQQNALNKLKQTSLLSEEELSVLQRQIAQRSKIADMSDAHALALATMRNERELDREQLLWEMEIGNQRLDLEMAREDKILDHDLARDNKIFENELVREQRVYDREFEREDKEFERDFARDGRIFEQNMAQQRTAAAFDDERRQANINFEHQQMSNQMDLLRQAQALREEREQAQHRRTMEAQKMQNEQEIGMEQIRSNTELEKQRIQATMSFEQIMASNPDISPEAAAALAKKFEAEAAAAQNMQTAAQNDRAFEIMRQHDEDLKAILSQQMNLTRDIVSAQTMASAATLENKQQELNRIHQDTQHNEDRYLDVVRSTLSAASGAKITAQSNKSESGSRKKEDSENVIFCPGCGKKHPAEAMFCDECGETL